MAESYRTETGAGSVQPGPPVTPLGTGFVTKRPLGSSLSLQGFLQSAVRKTSLEGEKVGMINQTKMTSEADICEQILVELAELYEQGHKSQYLNIMCEGPGAEATLRIVAQLQAEGSVEAFHQITSVRFTDNGYNKYKDQIAAVRSLLAGNCRSK